MTYDIIVFDEDEAADGSLQMKQHPENGVKAHNRKELIGTYAMCGQKVKIIREYSTDPQPTTPKQVVKAPTISHGPVVTQPQAVIAPVTVKPPEVIVPRFFSIGGVECKQEGNKIYEKQWVKISELDAENYRLISNSSNKIINITGKHLEMKKWVLVEGNNAQQLPVIENKIEIPVKSCIVSNETETTTQA